MNCRDCDYFFPDDKDHKVGFCEQKGEVTNATNTICKDFNYKE